MSENDKLEAAIIADAHDEATYPPELGGGRPRSEIFSAYLCKFPEEIEKVLNQNAGVYSYKYLIPHPLGVMVILSKLNPKAIEFSNRPRIEAGLEVIPENAATKETLALFPLDSDNIALQVDINVILARLYEDGYRICKQVDRTAPTPKAYKP